MKILFVCTGNTCRSPMAEGILKDIIVENKLDAFVFSRGLSVFSKEKASRNSIEAMEEIDIDISEHLSYQLTKADLDEADLILTMENSHRDIILSTYPEYGGKVNSLLRHSNGIKLDVLDPFGQNLFYYKKTRDIIRDSLEIIVKNNFLEV